MKGTEIIFSGGGGCLAHQLGVADSLIHQFGKQSLKKMKFGGYSAGACTSTLLYFSIHSDKSMKQLYQVYGQKIYQDEYKYNMFKLKEKNLDLLLSQIFKEIKQNEINFKNNLHISISIRVNNKLKNKLISEELDEEDKFIQAIRSSCFLPFITGKSFFHKFGEFKTLDGGFTSAVAFQDINNNIIHFDYLPSLTYYHSKLFQMPQNMTSIQFGFPEIKFTDFFFRNQQHADLLYEQGFNFLNNNQQQLQEIQSIINQQR